jgi:hypothetical protein
MSMPSGKLIVTHAYALDVANFLSVLTGDDFYTSRHPDTYERWSQRLSGQARQGIAAAVKIAGSIMLGPMVTGLVSAIPEFERMNLSELLAQPEGRFRAWEYFAPENMAVLQTLLPVVSELENLDFHGYWLRERLPLITAAAEQAEHFLGSLALDIGEAVSSMLGAEHSAGEPIRLYLCTFAAPHGIKIFGRRFISDVRFDPALMVRIAIHEMFHPPYQRSAVSDAAAALIGDPLFQESFASKNPKYGYATEDGFLEENMVEAMELHVSRRLGLIADPVEHLLNHDEGSHKLSLVLLQYFGRIAKREGEPFGAYLNRMVPEMAVGSLAAEYDALMSAWRAAAVR